LGGRVHDDAGSDLAHERENAGPIPDIELVVHEAFQLAGESLLVPAGVALGPKEDGPLVIVDSVNRVTKLAGEVGAHFGTDESGRARDEKNAFAVQSE
jgi:hypothetical protein